MLAKRIIPCLDVSNGRVVKGQQFKDVKDAGDPAELAARYSQEGADEIAFYDITASSEGRGVDEETVRKVAKAINIPLTVGGAIRSIDDFKTVLGAGADKVSVNTAAVENPEMIMAASKKYGAQCVVLSIDAKRPDPNVPKWNVFIYGGRKDTGIDLIEWVKRGYELGCGEIILNSIDSDGTRKGYDIEMLKQVRETVNIPVIASGGAGELQHLADAFIEADADAALAASIFHYDGINMKVVKEFLRDKGVHVRL
jgi:imidazole glycerol-phosphate synthase subunit HisF